MIEVGLRHRRNSFNVCMVFVANYINTILLTYNLLAPNPSRIFTNSARKTNFGRHQFVRFDFLFAWLLCSTNESIHAYESLMLLKHIIGDMGGCKGRLGGNDPCACRCPVCPSFDFGERCHSSAMHRCCPLPLPLPPRFAPVANKSGYAHVRRKNKAPHPPWSADALIDKTSLTTSIFIEIFLFYIPFNGSDWFYCDEEIRHYLIKSIYTRARTHTPFSRWKA